MLLYTVTGLLLVNVICWLSRLALSRRYFKHPRCSCEDSYYSGIHPVLLIPVLNEEKRLHACVETCRKLADAGPVTVVFATSCMEQVQPGLDNTIDLLRRYQKIYPWIQMYQCPVPGVMAHQVNHAVRSFQREYSGERNVLYALYNVDSVISVSTLKWVCAEYARMQNRRVIFQQYGCYTKNWEDLSHLPWYQRGILRANMLWQTRWSLGFEIPHAIMGQSLTRHKKVWMLNYCIGHGLYFNDMVYRIIGGFEEQTLNEDAMFGLQACFHNIPIIPVPELEAADSPDMVVSLLHQKTTWIYGPAQAFTYRKLILERNPNMPHVERTRLTILCIQLFEHALRWISIPILAFLGVLLCPSAPIAAIAAYVAVLTLYLGGLDLMCSFLLPCTLRPMPLDSLAVVYGAFIQFGMHGISGLIGFARLLRSRLSGTRIKKGKTEMKR